MKYLGGSKTLLIKLVSEISAFSEGQIVASWSSDEPLESSLRGAMYSHDTDGLYVLLKSVRLLSCKKKPELAVGSLEFEEI